jgi:CelD/BcsL family acetyltransferase involved in cellulose biosynthesis
MRYEIEWIRDEERLSALGEAWDDLAQIERSPFLLHAWFSAWWRAFGNDSSLEICALWSDGTLAGLFPLSRKGDSLVALANVHTPVFRPFARDAEALALVIEAAFDVRASELCVPALPQEDAATTLLAQAAQRAGRLSVIEAQHISPFIAIDGEFAQYRAALRSKNRSDMERLRRKMQREHEGVFKVVAAPSDLARELDDCFAVEQSGWKGRRGTAVLSDEKTALFYRSIAQAFNEQGMLRFSSIVLDGRLAAFDLNLLAYNRLYPLKTGYDESFARLSPGLVLHYAVIERCFDLSLETFELLGDDAEWKRRFATDGRRYCTFRAYRRRPIPTTRFVYRRVVRPFLKRTRTRLRRIAGTSPIV